MTKCHLSILFFGIVILVLWASSVSATDMDLAMANGGSDSDSILENLSISFIRGDANGDGEIDINDVVYLINWLYKGGPAPDPLLAGDSTCEGDVNG